MTAKNYAMIIGRPTADFTVKEVGKNGKQKATGTVAINERNGSVTFVRCEAWDKTADILGQLAKKGQEGIFVGRLSSAYWKDEAEQGHYTLAMTIEQVELLGSKKTAKVVRCEADVEPTVDDEAVASADEIESDDMPF